MRFCVLFFCAFFREAFDIFFLRKGSKPIAFPMLSINPKNDKIMEKDKRIRINKRMMAWSDGKRVNIIPSVFRQVDDYGSMLVDYHRRIDEGYLIDLGPCTTVREEASCREYEADRACEQGRHLEALREMMRAALFVLPDESVDFCFEDAQWLDPRETLYWHPNVREFLRLNRRCIELCKKDPRLKPVYEGSDMGRDYRKYLRNLNAYLHE